MIDIYGRVSYVYCQFLDKKIPILQPGGFRIESGVFYESHLAIKENGKWMNGYVFGQQDSIFLCKFLAKLV